MKLNENSSFWACFAHGRIVKGLLLRCTHLGHRLPRSQARIRRYHQLVSGVDVPFSDTYISIISGASLSFLQKIYSYSSSEKCPVQQTKFHCSNCKTSSKMIELLETFCTVQRIRELVNTLICSSKRVLQHSRCRRKLPGMNDLSIHAR